jgi:sodium-dependent dicarboxylate transporter 2/3/5
MAEAPHAAETAQPPWLATLGAVLSPLGAVVLWFVPLPLEPNAQRLLAIVWAVLVAWVSEVIALPVTAVLIAPALVLAGIAPAKKAFAAYADPILFLFVGSFFAAKAMSRHGLDQRLAHAISGLPQLAGRPGRTRFAVMLSAMLLSMWISNTATTAALLPVLLGMIGRIPVAARGQGGQTGSFAAGSVVALAHASTTGGLATLVGTPPNAITARILADAGFRVGFLDWMAIGVPTMLVLTLAVFAIIQRQLPAGTGRMFEGAQESTARPWSRAEKVTALSFVLMVAGWLLPDLATSFGASYAKTLSERLEPGAVALIASALLFMVPCAASSGSPTDGPVKRERVLEWRDAVQIEWGLVLLFGGGIALGEAMFSTGLAKVLGEGFIALTGVTGLWSLTAAALALAIVLTEFCSNVAAANMLVPLVIGAASQLGVSAIPPALAAGLGASCGFMLPVATGPNALVYGSGHIPTRSMISVGVRIDIVSFVVVFALLRLLCPLLGWT